MSAIVGRLRGAAAMLAAAFVAVLVLAGEAAAAHPTDEQTLQLRVIQFLGFGLIFTILVIWGFPFAAKLLRQRSEGIAADFDEAEGARAEAERAKAAAEQERKDLDRRSEEILGAATKQGAELKEQLLVEAEELVAATRKKAATDAEIERKKALVECTDLYIHLAFDGARTALGQAIDDRVQGALVDRFLDDMAELRG